MRTRDFILARAQKQGSVRTMEIVRALRISRQTVADHLRRLVREKKLLKFGGTRGARYVPYSEARARKKMAQPVAYSATRILKGLEEDRVFSEATHLAGLKGRLSEGVFSILNYGFTEMLNNAIEHSRSRRAVIRLWVDTDTDECRFVIRDYGIGVFESLRSKFGLEDSYEAVGHLLKGKQTTDPERHSGEGIFFTSKAADRFWLNSRGIKLIVDNVKHDMIVTAERYRLRGTEVSFFIKTRSRKQLSSIFSEFAGEDFKFDRTRVLVKLSAPTGEYLSRSEARRLLFGLEKFRRIDLDFSRVKGVGQGFADEIFRVFRNKHPDKDIRIRNAVPAVQFMIERAGGKPYNRK